MEKLVSELIECMFQNTKAIKQLLMVLKKDSVFISGGIRQPGNEAFFDMGIHYTRSIPPFGDNEEYWKSGVYRNGQIAFETDVNDAIPSRQSIVVNAYRPHSRAVDIYRKWFYLKNLILKSKKD